MRKSSSRSPRREADAHASKKKKHRAEENIAPTTPESARRRERRASRSKRARTHVLVESEAHAIDRSPPSKSNSADVKSTSTREATPTLSDESPANVAPDRRPVETGIIVLDGQCDADATLASRKLALAPKSPTSVQEPAHTPVCGGATHEPASDTPPAQRACSPTKPLFRAGATATEDSISAIEIAMAERKSLVARLDRCFRVDNIESITETNVEQMEAAFSAAASIFGPTEHKFLMEEYLAAIKLGVWPDIAAKAENLRKMLADSVDHLIAAIDNGPAMITPAQINFLKSLRYDESKPGNKKLGDLTVAEARRHITVLKSAQELMKKHNWS